MSQRVLFLHKYGQQAASFRYRFAQYFSSLEKHNFKIEVQSFFSDDYLKIKFFKKNFIFFQILWAFVRRICYLTWTKAPKVIVLYKDVLPYLPFFIEYHLILKRAPYVTDFDDAIYLNYEKSKNPITRFFLKNKFKKIFKFAVYNFAGNANLAEYASKENSRTIILPTVVNLEYYIKTKYTKNDDLLNTKNDELLSKQAIALAKSSAQLVIGWVGSPSTAQSLWVVKQALKIIQAQYHVKICLVGSGPIDLGLGDIEIRDWSLQSEIDNLLSFDIGIMPLEDNEWSRGKCGFKLIQYMACGLPVVGSPVGVNSNIVDHGKNGFLANSTEEWVYSLSQLIESQEMRLSFGQESRKKISEHYCLEKTAPIFIRHLKNVWSRDHV